MILPHWDTANCLLLKLLFLVNKRELMRVQSP